MNKRRRARISGFLMWSMAFTTLVLILVSSTPVGATNCCQTCESLDSTCPAACEAQCNGDSGCLDTCYGECLVQSDACWGIQGQGSYCIYCSYGACTYIWWEVETPSGHLLDSWCV